jgi:hypothetical protein
MSNPVVAPSNHLSSHSTQPHSTDPRHLNPLHSSDSEIPASVDFQTSEPFDSRTSEPAPSRTVSLVRPGTLDHRRAGTLRRLRTRTERGAATAEYAVTIVAACGLAGILVALLKSPVMLNALKALINYALKVAGVEGVHL